MRKGGRFPFAAVQNNSAGVVPASLQLCQPAAALFTVSPKLDLRYWPRIEDSALKLQRLLLTVCLLPAAWAFDDQPVVEWMKANAVQLQTPEAGHGFADMQPLKKIVGDARIVSLGEATHGTREFFQLKHRMLEFLASEMGFTIFSIEANMPEAYRLNEFVLTGKGDPAKLVKGMIFWTWDTQEVLDMVLWMREFNKSGKGHVAFTGFDMQFPDRHLTRIRVQG